MREAVDRFARHLASERGRSPNTVRGYVADVVSLLDHAGRMGGTDPADLATARGGGAATVPFHLAAACCATPVGLVS